MAIRDINLVPSELIHRRLMFRHLWLSALSLVLVSSLISGYYLYQTFVVLPQERPVTTVADMQKHLGVTIDDISSTEEEIERLNLQEAFLKRFTRNQPFSMLLLEMSQSINQKTWLTRFDIDSIRETEDRVARNFRLYGYSYSNDELGDFLTRLSSQELFRDVVLRFAQETQIASWEGDGKDRVKVIQFQIEGLIVGT